jgi:hypothetical protein
VVGVRGAWLLLPLLAVGCAHQPPVVPPSPWTDIVLGTFLPPDLLVCVESPHRNSYFDTPVARGDAAPCVTLDSLRHWIAGQKAADE